MIDSTSFLSNNEKIEIIKKRDDINKSKMQELQSMLDTANAMEPKNERAIYHFTQEITACQAKAQVLQEALDQLQ